MAAEQLSGLVRADSQRFQQPFDGHELVACLSRQLFRFIQKPRRIRGQIHPAAAALNTRQPAKRRIDRPAQACTVRVGLLQQPRSKPLLIFQQ